MAEGPFERKVVPHTRLPAVWIPHVHSLLLFHAEERVWQQVSCAVRGHLAHGI